MGKCAERLLLRSAATDYTHFTPYIVFRQVNAWGKNQRRRLFECKVIKGHSILYRQPMEINVWKWLSRIGLKLCWTNRYFRYIHWEKIPEILLFPLLSFTRAKSRKYVIFATSNGYSSNTKERESQVHTANWFFIPSVSFGTSFSSKYASHLRSKLFLH